MIKKSGLTKQDFADKIDISSRQLFKYLKEEQQPPYKFFNNIKKHFSGIDINWLVTGKGSMLLENSKNHIAKLNDGSVIDTDDFAYVPFVAAKLSAGDGSFETEADIINYYAFKISFIKRVTLSHKNLVLMRVKGDSMYPKIEDGDVVMIDTGKQDIYPSKIYAIRIADTIHLKQIDLKPKSRAIIISKNKAIHPAFEIDTQDLCIIGQVVWSCREFEKHF